MVNITSQLLIVASVLTSGAFASFGLIQSAPVRRDPGSWPQTITCATTPGDRGVNSPVPCYVTLNAVTSSAQSVSLSTTAGSVPASVTVLANRQSAQFTLTLDYAGQPAIVSASANGTTIQQQVN